MIYRNLSKKLKILFAANNSFNLLFHFISYIFIFHIVMTFGMINTIFQNFFFCFTFYYIITIKSSFSTTYGFHKLTLDLYLINNYCAISGISLESKVL